MSKFLVEVNNVPPYAYENKYIIARLYDASLWFYGSTNNPEEARKIATEIDGVIIEVENN